MFSHETMLTLCVEKSKNSFRQSNNFSLSKIRMKKNNFVRCMTLEKNEFDVIAKKFSLAMRFFLSMNNGLEPKYNEGYGGAIFSLLVEVKSMRTETDIDTLIFVRWNDDRLCVVTMKFVSVRKTKVTRLKCVIGLENHEVSSFTWVKV